MSRACSSRPPGLALKTLSPSISLFTPTHHHLRCRRTLRIPTIVPHRPTIAPRLLTGRPRPTTSHHQTPSCRTCRPLIQARSLQARSLTPPPSDQMERPSTIHSSTSSLLLHVRRPRSHNSPIELSLQGDLVRDQDAAPFTHLIIPHTAIRPRTAL